MTYPSWSLECGPFWLLQGRGSNRFGRIQRASVGKSPASSKSGGRREIPGARREPVPGKVKTGLSLLY